MKKAKKPEREPSSEALRLADKLAEIATEEPRDESDDGWIDRVIDAAEAYKAAR